MALRLMQRNRHLAGSYHLYKMRLQRSRNWTGAGNLDHTALRHEPVVRAVRLVPQAAGSFTENTDLARWLFCFKALRRDQAEKRL
jgi:hypothetical protein